MGVRAPTLRGSVARFNHCGAALLICYLCCGLVAFFFSSMRFFIPFLQVLCVYFLHSFLHSPSFFTTVWSILSFSLLCSYPKSVCPRAYGNAWECVFWVLCARACMVVRGMVCLGSLCPCVYGCAWDGVFFGCGVSFPPVGSPLRPGALGCNSPRIPRVGAAPRYTPMPVCVCCVGRLSRFALLVFTFFLSNPYPS